MKSSTATVRESPARRPGGRSARKRQAVFQATLRMLAEDGYQALSVEGVAAAAGVNKTTIYRNWPTKASLVLAAAEARSEELIVTEATGHPERDLVAFLTSVADNITSPLGQALVAATLGDAGDPDVGQARRDFWQHRFRAADPLVRSSFGHGRRATEAEVKAAIERLIAPIFLRAVVTGEPIDAPFIAETVRWVMRGRSRLSGAS